MTDRNEVNRSQVAAVIAGRQTMRRELIDSGREYVTLLQKELPLIAAAVVGSVARGDFNLWSDVDVVVVAEGLPSRIPDRMDLLVRWLPGRVQPVAFTPGEFMSAHQKGNPLALEAVAGGVVLLGEEFFGEMALAQAGREK